MPKSNIKAWRHREFWKHYHPREPSQNKMELVEEEIIPEVEAGGVGNEPKYSSRRFDLFFCVGGYWSKDDEYFGGEHHSVGSLCSDGFNRSSITKIVVDDLGYEDTMNMVSWFPPGSVLRKVDILDEDTLGIAVRYGISVGALTLYIARSDDPFVGRHKDMRGYMLGEAEEDEGEDATEFASEFATEDASEAGGVDLDVPNSDSSFSEHVEDTTISTSDSENENGSSSRKKSVFRLGQEFANMDELKRCIIKYAVKKKRDIKFDKSEQKRLVAICSDKKCPWRICGTINSSSPRVVIRSYNEEHNCTWQGQISLLTNTRIDELFLEDFRINPHISASQLQLMLLKRNINVSDTKCERSRLHCLQTFDDESSETFGRFYDYVEELKRSNPGSTIELDVRQGMFHRFYVCFKALKDGWRSSCRKIIHIDGTFLKWRMNGMLLIACGRDPNDQMFPIAWGIVDIENKDNWMWFFEHLQEDLGLEEGNGLTLSSDQQKGLIVAVKAVLPYAEHKLDLIY